MWWFGFSSCEFQCILSSKFIYNHEYSFKNMLYSALLPCSTNAYMGDKLEFCSYFIRTRREFEEHVFRLLIRRIQNNFVNIGSIDGVWITSWLFALEVQARFNLRWMQHQCEIQKSPCDTSIFHHGSIEKLDFKGSWLVTYLAEPDTQKCNRSIN